MRLTITLLFTSIFLISCGIYEDLSLVGQPEVEVKGISDGNIELDLILEINNPNNQSFHVKKASFEIYLNDQLIGHTTMDKKTKIKANSNEEYSFPMKIKLDGKDLSLGMLLGSIFQSRVELRIDGDIKAGTFFYNQRFPVEWEERISL